MGDAHYFLGHCQCGTGCGLTWIRTKTNRRRKWHPECKSAKSILTQRKQSQKRKNSAASKVDKPDSGALKGKRKWCEVCSGLPWRRPIGGACNKYFGCGEPYSAEPKPELTVWRR